MFAHLKTVLPDFLGAINQTWCFAHTVNLCAKSILKHFDLPKKDDAEALDRTANALADLADNIDYGTGGEQERANKDEEEADQIEYLEA